MMREVGRVLSVPGGLVLAIVTALAALFVFRPARQRLRALEEATARLGAGDLSARAPERGGDEIARVAQAFNRMASELAVREEALRASDRLRRQMLADVSHELNTPLTAMRGYLETLHMADVALDAPTRERYLQTVEMETRRLERMVKDLLDLARHENAAVELDIRTFAVGRLFNHVALRHEAETTSRNIRVQVEVDERADQIVGDPDRLEQVIENLVANALRHTPDGGTIELRATCDGETAALAVVDSGEGIPREHLARVFERFYKVDASRYSIAGGSGLGLSIAKAIVERHGGTIGVTSEPGRTEFRIALPNQSASANL
jgi:signal transduction histidine kinase